MLTFGTLGLLAIIFAGCGRGGPELASVTGKVTLDGKPLQNAIITFTPLDGGVASSGTTSEDGTYSLVCPLGKGALVGKHRISVHSQPPGSIDSAGGVDEDDPKYGTGWDASARAPVFIDPIPARYNINSELVRDVKPGKNVIDLELTSKQ